MLCLLILIKHLLLPCVYKTFFSHFFTIFCVVRGIYFASFYSKSIKLKHISIPLDLNLGHFATLKVFQVTQVSLKSVCDANLTWCDRSLTSIWERPQRQCLERGGPLKQSWEVIEWTFNAVKPDLITSSQLFPIGVRGSTWCSSPTNDKPECYGVYLSSCRSWAREERGHLYRSLHFI